ncbi:MAG TPA: hypothetical protein DCM68_05275 [Verrucomicrobia bacterium]|nr:hypothetical protein [Verrucomicrobiota bacterium]
MVSLVVLAGGLAYGAFEMPSQEQLQAAAEDPSQFAGLLVDASIDQAAETAKDVITQIVALDLEPEEEDARAAEIVRQLFRAMPEDQWPALARSFGRFVAASPTASLSRALLSAMQQAIIQVGDVELGNTFGNAYNLAMQTIAGAPGGGKNVPPPPPPPPVAQPYEGQQFP